MTPIEELTAEREIRKLLALYPQYADDNKPKAWARLFTENGVLQAGDLRAVGHAALESWLISVQSGSTMRHMMLNAAITIESPSEARCSMDMLLLGAENRKWVVISAPRYTDRIVKTSAGWRFAERILELREPGTDGP